MTAAPLRIMCLSNMYPGPEDPDYGAFVATMSAALEAEGHHVDRVVIAHRRGGRLRTPAKYLGLLARALMRTRRSDVIYAHYLVPTGVIAAICGRLLRRPWVVTAHGGDVANLRSRPIRVASRVAVGRAGGVIAVSEYLAARMRTGIPTDRPIDVINMGVDTERFRPGDRAAARRRLGLPDADRVVLAVGGLTERKNPLRLLDALAPLLDAHADLRLVYVGHGPLRDTLRSDAEARGLSGRVTLTGTVEGAAVAEWMAACDVLALPSIVEPLGVVALEALASGRPVVATRTGGTSEVIGDCGVLVDPMDPADIRRGIERMLDTPPDPRACARQAARHSVAVQAGRVAEVLRRATDPRGPAIPRSSD